MSAVDINPAEIEAKMHSYSLLKRYNGLATASKQAYILEGNMSILSFPDIFSSSCRLTCLYLILLHWTQKPARVQVS